MKHSKETEFKNHIRQNILSDVLANNEDFKLFDFKIVVDVLIAKNGENPKLFFLEIKYHKKSHSR